MPVVPIRPCFLENGNVRVGVLPERQEIAVDTLRLHRAAREHECSCQLQARHRVHVIDEDDTAMIEHPLELAGALGADRLRCTLLRQPSWSPGRRRSDETMPPARYMN